MDTTTRTPEEILELWISADSAPFTEGEDGVPRLATPTDWNGFEPGTSRMDIFKELGKDYPGGAMALGADKMRRQREASAVAPQPVEPSVAKAVEATADVESQEEEDITLPQASAEMGTPEPTFGSGTGKPTPDDTELRNELGSKTPNVTAEKEDSLSAFDEVLRKSRATRAQLDEARKTIKPSGEELEDAAGDTVPLPADTPLGRAQEALHAAMNRETEIKAADARSLADKDRQLRDLETKAATLRDALHTAQLTAVEDKRKHEAELKRLNDQLEIEKMNRAEDLAYKANIHLGPIAAKMGLTTDGQPEELTEEIMAALERHNEAARSLQERLEAMQNECNTKNQEAEALRAKAIRYEAETELLNEKCNALQEENSALSEDKNTLITELAEKDRALAQQSGREQYWEKSLANANKTIESLEGEFTAAAERIQDEINKRIATQHELEVLQASARDAAFTSEELVEAKTLFGDEFLKWKHDMAAKEAQIERLSAEVDLRDSRIAIMEAEATSIEEVFEKREAQLNAARDTVARASLSQLCLELGISMPAAEKMEDLVHAISVEIGRNNELTEQAAYNRGLAAGLRRAQNLGKTVDEEAFWRRSESKEAPVEPTAGLSSWHREVERAVASAAVEEPQQAPKSAFDVLDEVLPSAEEPAPRWEPTPQKPMHREKPATIMPTRLVDTAPVRETGTMEEPTREESEVEARNTPPTKNDPPIIPIPTLSVPSRRI